jgi:two-component system response regulator
VAGRERADRPVLLLVDDSPEFAFLVTRLGERAGCAVISCPDPQSALEQIRVERPDLILLDRNLGGQDGLDLVRHLASVEDRPPVALFCHAGLSVDQAEALQAGVDFFFLKDLVSNSADWEQRLGEILARVAGRHSGAPLESSLHGECPRAPSNLSPPVPTPEGIGIPGPSRREPPRGDLPPPGATSVPGHANRAREAPGSGPTRMDTTKEKTPPWVMALSRGLRHPAVRGIGAEVLQVLLRRGLLYALAYRPPDRREDVEAVLGAGIDLDRLGAVCSLTEAERLLAFLADRFECLLGRQAAAHFRKALAPHAPSTAFAGVPANLRDVDPSPPRRQALSPSRALGSPEGGHLCHTVLLVEDNEPEIAITRRAIRECELSLDLFVVRDGQEALDYLLRQGRYAPEGGGPWRFPDLILLDLNLPRLDGGEVLQRIRATPSLRTVPVVILSNSRRPEDVRDLYAAGANTYIEKPHDFTRFVEVMRTIHHYWLGTALLPPAP